MISRRDIAAGDTLSGAIIVIIYRDTFSYNLHASMVSLWYILLRDDTSIHVTFDLVCSSFSFFLFFSPFFSFCFFFFFFFLIIYTYLSGRLLML